MIDSVKIPGMRMAVLIGKNAATKRMIEKTLGVKLDIRDGVSIEGEPLNVMDAKNVVLAIGRGFSPENAILLASEENTLCIIYLSKDEKKQKRLKSRIIGEAGRTRENIERITGVHISIYGKTVAIIGEYEAVDITRQAIEQFMKGFSHRSVYAFLEKWRAGNPKNKHR